jgi:zinc protease
VMEAMFPPEHPYHWMTIGSTEDIRAMKLDDVQAFFRMYYHPSNASLALAGDIETGEALKLAERYFGELPAGTKPQPVSASASMGTEVRLLLEDRVELPRLYIGWHSPAMFADGDAEMDLVSDMLANGKTSRLYRVLVYERRIALDVSAYQSSREMGSFFLMVATAAPGRSLSDIAAAIDQELNRMTDDGPTADEMERSSAQAEAHFMYRLQTVGGFGGKSDQLNAYNVFVKDPGYFGRDLARYQQATAQSVQAVAQTVLRPDRRVVLSVVPRGQTSSALAGSEAVTVS